ncbi:MAG: SDR family NAD(P)-dependent oxidoreductase [Planctomycetota bacterium]|nr:MAG: SDR family NAD(P)-dependent oxidoreductase [Planctomycetota bacterium]
MKSNQLRTYQGAVAIVTGAASGIGYGLVRELVKREASVVLADRQQERVEEIAASLRAAGGNAMAATVDVVDEAAVKAVVEAAANRFGRLDYLFNNAGISIGGEVKHYQTEDWTRVFDVNLRGVANGVQAAYPIMLSQGYGHIVNTSSVCGLLPSPWCVSYAASKFGVLGLSISLRVEAAAAGVRISALCPGTVRTAMLEDYGKYGKLIQPVSSERQRQFWDHLNPMEPEEFARQALRAVAKNRGIIVIPRWWRAIWWVNRLSPSLGQRLARIELARTKAGME